MVQGFLNVATLGHDLVADRLPELTARLADPSFFLEPEFHLLLRHLRHHSPVYWCQAWPTRGFWALTRYADIKQTFDQPLLFSNEAAGNIIPADPRFHVGNREAMGFNAMPTNTDPPKHGEVRRLFARYFSGPGVARLESRTQAVVDGILEEVRETKECNFVLDVAAQLPARLICDVLGVPREDWPLITRYANSFASFSDPELQLGESPADTFRIAMTAMFEYVGKLVAQRRKSPRDDFASVVATAWWRDAALPARDAAWWAFAILAAGFETSRNVIAGGLLALVQHPEQWTALKDERRLMQQAVDEMVRWTTPATAILRVATKDCSIGNQPISAGDWVTAWLDSANRDESVFDEPETFNISSRRAPAMSFGYGPHNCIGRMLAIQEVKAIIGALLDRTDGVELTGPVSYIASTIAKGPKMMPVRFRWT